MPRTPRKVQPSSDDPPCLGHSWPQHKVAGLLRDGMSSQPETLSFDTRPNFLMAHVWAPVPVRSREGAAAGGTETLQTDALGAFPRLGSLLFSAEPHPGSIITAAVVKTPKEAEVKWNPTAMVTLSVHGAGMAQCAHAKSGTD